MDILVIEQTPDNPGWFQGTADAVRQSLRHISNLEYDHILILSGDQLYQMDFGDMLKNHIVSQTDISIATIPVDDRDAPEFGILKTNEQNVITSFIEKPKKDLLPECQIFFGLPAFFTFVVNFEPSFLHYLIVHHVEIV